MSSKHDDKHYAWGASDCSGLDCPALAAGFSMDNFAVRHVAEVYDMMASHYPSATRQEPGRTEIGTITARDAREAWLDAIERLNERLGDGYDDMDELHAAARIAHDLGWDDYYRNNE